MKPFLRENKIFKLEDYPEATAFEAGFLVTKNSGWRSQKPVINENKCTGCLQCYLYCPDGVISQNEKVMVIDYNFCKGCGICKKICKLGVIEMEAERS